MATAWRWPPDMERTVSAGHDLDPGGAGIHGLVKMDRPALELHLAGRGRKVAGDDLDQGRFAGAVIAHEADDLARLEVEIDPRQRLDGAEMLRDAVELEQGHSQTSRSAASDRVRPRQSAVTLHHYATPT